MRYVATVGGREKSPPVTFVKEVRESGLISLRV
jgi:hypothetical protein